MMFRRQVQTPSRPSRSLSSSITRVVRRGYHCFFFFFFFFLKNKKFPSFLVCDRWSYLRAVFLVLALTVTLPEFAIYLVGKSITGAESPGVDANGNSFDFSTKLLHLAWHPTENSIACAAANSLYMYYA